MEDIPEVLRDLVRALTEAGRTPVLVGGLAARLLGFPELTEDLDFCVAAGEGGEGKAETGRLLHGLGFRLLSRLDPTTNEPLEYVEDADETAGHLRRADPTVAFFWHPEARLRVDLLFDFPVEAAKLGRRARRVRLEPPGVEIAAASAEDLRDLYRTSYNYRRQPKDLRAFEFLEGLLRRDR